MSPRTDWLDGDEDWRTIMNYDEPLEDWTPSGIDVDSLHRSATEVEILVSADELRALAERTRDEAKRRERAVLDARWTWWKDR